MGEHNLESALSLAPLSEDEAKLINPVQFFDPDSVKREGQEYSDPLSQQINQIINDGNYLPFNIISAAKTNQNGEEKLELRGEYKTFDGLTIDVSFKGVYGDPEKNAFLSLPLKKEDAFWSFDLEARVIGADIRQERIFSLIGLRDQNVGFFESRLHHEKYKSNFAPDTASGFDNIRKIGKIVAIYEQVHIKELVKEIFDKKRKFEQELSGINFTDYKLEIKLMEFQGPDDELDSIAKHMRDIAFEFIPVARMKAIKEDKLYTVTINYDSAIGKDNSIWSIDMEWPYLMKILNINVLNEYNDALKAGPKKELPGEFSRLHHSIMFVMDAFGFRWHDTEDFVSNASISTFDDCVLEARKEVLKTKIKYCPLYLTITESNIRLIDDEELFSRTPNLYEGILRFRKKEDYAAFQLMAVKALLGNTKESRMEYLYRWVSDNVLRQKGTEMRYLVKDAYVQMLLDKEPQLKRRVMTFYECYRKDPENARELFNKLDPAYVLGEKIYKERETNKARNLS
jgi:hypothetical protein